MQGAIQAALGKVSCFRLMTSLDLPMLLDPSLIVLLLIAGVIAGTLAGLFGIGGGLVIVPALFFLLQALQVPPEVAMAMAVSTSLVSIIPTAISSLRAHHKLGNVDWLIVKRWCPPMIAGVLVGASLVAVLRTPFFVLFFGCLLLFVAISKLVWRKPRALCSGLPAYWVQALAAAAIGWASAIAGVGGGATGVPALTAMSVPIHRAVGTCAALGLAIALPGAAWLFLLSQTPPQAPAGTVRLIYLPALLFLAPATVLCAPLGARLGKRLSPQILSYCFATLLVLIGGRMVLSAF